MQNVHLVFCSGNASEKPKVKVENGGDHGTLALAQPPAKRSKKGKKKHQGQASAADYLKVTPLSREADLLREVWLMTHWQVSCRLLELQWMDTCLACSERLSPPFDIQQLSAAWCWCADGYLCHKYVARRYSGILDVQENAHTQLSKSEKAQQMTLSEDKLSVTSHKGYRMVCVLYTC